MLIYLSIASGIALIFTLVASFSGSYHLAAIGGAVWVGFLSIFVSMPLVISRVKKQLKS